MVEHLKLTIIDRRFRGPRNPSARRLIQLLEPGALRRLGHAAKTVLAAREDLHDEKVRSKLDHLERDHREADRHHVAVDGLGRRWLATGGLHPAEVRALRAHLVALHAIYREHIGIEDRELFPAAARLLSSAQLIEVGLEMATRRKAGCKTVRDAGSRAPILRP